MAAVTQKAWSDTAGQMHEGPIFASVDGFEVIDCCVCGFKHAIPLPTPVELETIYRHEYYSSEKPLYIQRYLEDKDWWDSVYDQRYDFLESRLPSKRRRILDVGSGPGLFLLKGRERNWTVKGIEPSTQAATHARDTLGLDISETTLTAESAKHLGRFDAINMGEVLEHLPNPLSMLRLTLDLLEPGGLLCIIVPNDFNPFQCALRDGEGYAPWWVAPPHHLNYFDFDSLTRLIQQAGYKVLHKEATFPIDLFLLMGDNYIGQQELGRACHSRRMRFDLALHRHNKVLLREWSQSLAQLGLGREIVLFAQKPDHA